MARKEVYKQDKVVLFTLLLKSKDLLPGITRSIPTRDLRVCGWEKQQLSSALYTLSALEN